MDTIKQRVVDLLTRRRAEIMVAIGLPAGLLFEKGLRLQQRLRSLVRPTPERHAAKVEAVCQQVRRWARQPKAQRRPMCTDRKPWMAVSPRFTPKGGWEKIRMGALRDVLELDREKLTVRVEPFVTIAEITPWLAERGYMLAVHLEMGDATIGGLAIAAGMTTHSHKVGMLFETVSEWEVVLADGSLVRVTENEHPDLFRALPWSHGTLGLVVSLTLRVVPVKPYVRLRFEPYDSRAAYLARIYELATADDAPHFVEATVFSKERAIVFTGDFTDAQTPDEQRRINRFGRWYKPWLHKYLETLLGGGPREEVWPLADYLLRHNRSIFWAVDTIIPYGNHPLFRALLGWMMPPRISFIKFATTPAIREMTVMQQVFQDNIIPLGAMAEAIDLAEELFDTYPLLIYPSRLYDRGEKGGQLPRPAPERIVPGTNYAMYADLGLYGIPRAVREGRPFEMTRAMRRWERFVRSVRGFPFLDADTFMTRAEFAQTFDLTLYDEVRERYGATDAFPHLYEKIKSDVDVLRGVETT